MVADGEVVTEVPVVALAARMTPWAVGRRWSHPFVSFSASRWAATTGWSASAVCSQVATSIRISVRPRWSCGAGMGGFGRFTSVHCWNHTRARLSAQRESGAAITQGDLTATACRNAKTLSQLSAMVANVLEAAVLAEACFALPGFFVSAAAVSAEACFALPGFFSSAASIVTTLLSSLDSLASLEGSASNDHSMMDQDKTFRSLPAYESPWRMVAFVKNDRRRTAFQEVQLRYFFDRVRFPAAARRRTSAIGRRIFLLSVTKAISMLNGITEGELRSPTRAKATTDYPSDLFPTAA